MRDWEPIGAGGESGMTAGDPLHPGIIFGGTGQRFDLETNTRGRRARRAATPSGVDRGRLDAAAGPLEGRPARALLREPVPLQDRLTRRATWTKISPAISRGPIPAFRRISTRRPRAHTDRNGKRGVIYAVSPSPLLAPMLWIGTDDGLIQLTTNDGKTWQNVTPPALRRGAASRDRGVALRLQRRVREVDRHQLQDFEPYIYRTRDMGKTWQKITNGLPAGVYVHVVKEDPKRQGLLFAGTERGAFISFDDGDTWQPLQLNLPVTSVRDFEIYENDLDRRHARARLLGDRRHRPLRQVDDTVLERRRVSLQAVRHDQYACRAATTARRLQKDEPQAPNPPNGAFIDYYLEERARGPVTLEILDAAGATLRTFSSERRRAAQRHGGGGGRGGGGAAEFRIRPRSGARRPSRSRDGAGMHRVVWQPGAAAAGGRRWRGGGRGGGGAPLTPARSRRSSR